MREQEYDYFFKLFLLGDKSIGKSSLLLRYTEDTFPTFYKETIGINFGYKIINTLNKTVKLHLWDTGGAQRFREIVKTCIHNANGALICFDVTNQNSFREAIELISLFRENVLKKTSIVLVGCKSDLIEERVIDFSLAQKTAEKLGINYLETSSLAKTNVAIAFELITKELLFRPILEEIITLLNDNFENYLKLYSPYNAPGFFTTKPSNGLLFLQSEYTGILQRLFASTNQVHVNDFYRKTQELIKRTDQLYELESPYWSKCVRNPLSTMLEQSLIHLCHAFPDTQNSHAEQHSVEKSIPLH